MAADTMQSTIWSIGSDECFEFQSDATNYKFASNARTSCFKNYEFIMLSISHREISSITTDSSLTQRNIKRQAIKIKQQQHDSKADSKARVAR